MHVCVCVRARFRIGSVSSFSPVTLLNSNGAPQVTITGLGLDVYSVRAVRYEPSASCTVAVVNATTGTVNGTTIAAVSGSNQTTITVTQNGTIASASYSVCVDFVANVASGSFVKVGSWQLLIREYCVFDCLTVVFFAGAD